MNRFVAPLATIAVGVVAVSALAVVNQDHSAGSVELNSKPGTASQWTVNQLSDENVSYLLSATLPYYRVNAPTWCSEVMACWTGSNADTRTDRQVLAALRCDIARGSYSGVAVNLSDTQSATYMAGLDTVCGEGK